MLYVWPKGKPLLSCMTFAASPALFTPISYLQLHRRWSLASLAPLLYSPLFCLMCRICKMNPFKVSEVRGKGIVLLPPGPSTGRKEVMAADLDTSNARHIVGNIDEPALVTVLCTQHWRFARR